MTLLSLCSYYAGAKLKQKKALVAPPPAPLEILEDEDLAEQQPQPAQAGGAAHSTLRQRLDAPDLEEHLQHDPLRLHKVCRCCNFIFIAHYAILSHCDTSKCAHYEQSSLHSCYMYVRRTLPLQQFRKRPMHGQRLRQPQQSGSARRSLRGIQTCS